jgi:hypothetical protein
MKSSSHSGTHLSIQHPPPRSVHNPPPTNPIRTSKLSSPFRPSNTDGGLHMRDAHTQGRQVSKPESFYNNSKCSVYSCSCIDWQPKSNASCSLLPSNHEIQYHIRIIYGSTPSFMLTLFSHAPSLYSKRSRMYTPHLTSIQSLSRMLRA